MKGLSVLFTVFLLALAQQLAWRLRDAGMLPAQKEAGPKLAAGASAEPLPRPEAFQGIPVQL